MVREDNPKTTPIERKVINALESNIPLTIADVDGVTGLYENITVVSNSSFLPEFLSVLVKYIESYDEDEKKKAEQILLNSICICNNAFIIKDVILKLDEASSLLPELSDKYFKILIEEAKKNDKCPIVRAWLLEAAFRMSLSKSSRKYILLAFLVEVSSEDDAEYLWYVSKILGLAYSCWKSFELIEKLKGISVIGKKKDEAFYELGMCYLYDALEAKTLEDAVTNFSLAKESFHKSIEAGIERPDAEAYEIVISILLSLDYSLIDSSMKYSIKKLNELITMYISWHNSAYEPMWLRARNTEMVNWYCLINKLEKLLIHLNEPAWYEPKTVIESYLLKIYTSSRTLLKRDESGGLELILQPEIEAKLNQNSSFIFVFKNWLELHKEPELKKVGERLLNQLSTFKDKASISNVITSCSELTLEQKNSFQQFLAEYRVSQTNKVELKIEQIFNKCASELIRNNDYKNNLVSFEFDSLLFHSLKFLLLRMNVSKENFKGLNYLFEQDDLPHEYELQNDYFQFMLSNLVDGSASIEKRDIGSGRVDVYFSFERFNVSAEIKRDWKDCSFETIRNNYLGQAAEYSNTDIKLGFLLVLDLTKKSSGIKSIEDSVKVEFIKKNVDSDERAIVVLVVPGMRKKPNQVSISQ